MQKKPWINNKSPHAHRRGGFNILHQSSFSISPCTKETISQSKLSSLILPTNASAIAFGPMSLFTIRTPPFNIRIATNLLTYAFILILYFFTFVLNVQIFCKQKACNGFSHHCRPFVLIFIFQRRGREWIEKPISNLVGNVLEGTPRRWTERPLFPTHLLYHTKINLLEL